MIIERTIEVAAGIALAACLVGLVYGQSSPALCVHGHPAPRDPEVSYGGLLPKAGFQRDHIVPLCLGGPDTAANVQYQPLVEAKIKDRREWAACESYCRGDISLDDARALFQATIDNPRLGESHADHDRHPR